MQIILCKCWGDLSMRRANFTSTGEELSVALAAKWGGQLIEALAHLEGLAVIHRDVKEGNVFCSSSRAHADAILGDFGLACFSAKTISDREIAGTPLYFAPEVWNGKQSCKQDAWAAGVTIYTLLRGMHPFSFGKLNIEGKTFTESISLS